MPSRRETGNSDQKSRTTTSLLTTLMYWHDVVLYDPKFRNASEICTVSHNQVEAMLYVKVETGC